MQDGSKTGLRAVRQNVPTSWKCRYGTKDTKNAGRFQNRTAGNLAKRSDLLKAPLRRRRYEQVGWGQNRTASGAKKGSNS